MNMNRHPSVAAAIALASVLCSCSGVPAATSAPTGTSGTPTPGASPTPSRPPAPSASPGLPTASPRPTSAASPTTLPSMSVADAINSIGAAGKIAFYRRDDGYPAPAFVIDPDGANESAITERGSLPGIWSPDGDTLALTVWVPDPSPQPGAEAEWIRPALVRPGDSSPTVLSGAGDREMHLVPLGWSADGSRLFVYSGFDAIKSADSGVFSVDASDGSDLSLVLPAERDALGRFDFVEVSPDGKSLLVSRELKDDGGA